MASVHFGGWGLFFSYEQAIFCVAKINVQWTFKRANRKAEQNPPTIIPQQTLTTKIIQILFNPLS